MAVLFHVSFLLLLLLLLMFTSGVRCDIDSLAGDEEEGEEEYLEDKGVKSEYEEQERGTGRGERDPQDRAWATKAIRDVAFYLRSHKFNDFDRRYHTPDKPIVKEFAGNFPIPPLRMLHWEVRKHCDESFDACLLYLHEKAQLAELTRGGDTTTVIKERKLDETKDRAEIQRVDEECLKAYNLDYIGGVPFMGPLERFQWRASASYYMCWYTMRETKDLAMFGEDCDNHARCLERETGAAHNGDVRADDTQAFACAQYSFCPDACCPQRATLRDRADCWAARDNPCFSADPAPSPPPPSPTPERRQCAFNRSRNADFVSMVLNHWNTTCNCSHAGFVWDARYRLCVDVDECVEGGKHTCQRDVEACFNLPGAYACACSWGHLFDARAQRCVPSPQLGQGWAAIEEAPDPRRMPWTKRMRWYAAKARNRTRLFARNVKGYFARASALRAAMPLEMALYYLATLYILLNIVSAD